MALLSTKTGLPSFSDVDQSIINIVDNPSARRDTTGWTAATNYSVTRDISNSPLAGVIDTCFAISTTTASTESSTSGVYAASLAMPAALRNNKVQGNLWVTVPATSAGVWRLSVYNASGTRMNLDRDSSGVWTLPGGYTGQLPFTFDADSSATYTISFTQTTRTSSNTLYATLISIGNGQVSQTAPISEWQSYTPTVSNLGTGSGTAVGYWRRLGSNAEIHVLFTKDGSGGSGAAGVTFSIPSSLNINSSVISANREAVGTGWTTTSLGTIAALARSGAPTVLSLGATAGGDIGGSLFTASSVWTFTATIPIAEWAGSVSTGPVPAEEFAFNSTAWGTTNSSAFAYGPGGATITGSVGAGFTQRVRFQYPVQADDELVLEYKQPNGMWVPSYQTIGAYLTTAATEYGARFVNVAGSTTDVDVLFSQYQNQGATYNSYTGAGNWNTSFITGWRLRKTKKAALPFANAGTDGSAGLYKAGQAPGLTTGAAISSGNIGEKKEVLFDFNPTTSSVISTSSALGLTKGVWQVFVAGYCNVAASINGVRVGISTDSTATTFSDLSTGPLNFAQSRVGTTTNQEASAYISTYVNISADTNYYAKVVTYDAGARVRGNITATRIA